MQQSRPRDEHDMAREALDNIARPVFPKPKELPQVTRFGVGYLGEFAGGITIEMRKLVEHRDEFTGEYVIKAEGTDRVGNVLEWGRMNLLASRTRTMMANALSKLADAEWPQILEMFCREVVRMEREGPPIQRTNHAAPAPVSYVLEPMLPRGLVTILFGQGGIGKSTMAAAMAVSVATGREIFKGWKPVQGNVLILDWEATLDRWQESIQAISLGLGMDPPEIAYRECKRRLADDVDTIAAAVDSEKAALVICDSAGLAFGTNPLEADKADSTMRAFSAMRETTSTAWLVIDHESGGDVRSEQSGSGHVTPKPYGSIYKMNLARQVFYLKSEKEAEGDRQELLLVHTKGNYSRKMRPQGVIVYRPEAGIIMFDRDDHLTAPELTAALSMSQRVIQLLEGVKDHAMSHDRMTQLLGITEKARGDQAQLSATLKKLTANASLVKLGDGRYGLGTPMGF